MVWKHCPVPTYPIWYHTKGCMCAGITRRVSMTKCERVTTYAYEKKLTGPHYIFWTKALRVSYCCSGDSHRGKPAASHTHAIGCLVRWYQPLMDVRKHFHLMTRGWENVGDYRTSSHGWEKAWTFRSSVHVKSAPYALQRVVHSQAWTHMHIKHLPRPVVTRGRRCQPNATLFHFTADLLGRDSTSNT